MNAMLELLATLLGKLVSLNTVRKQEVAAHLNRIADVIESFSPKLKAGVDFAELQGLAVRTRELAEGFSNVTSDVLPRDKREEFVKALDAAVNAKQLLVDSMGSKREALLLELATAAARFRGAADNLNGSASKIG